MKRFTKKDWETINTALAHLEAEDLDNYRDMYPDLHARIEKARLRVWERLERYKNWS